MNNKLYNQHTLKWKIHCLYKQNIPHKTASGSNWCLPVWLIWLIGGNFDSGNGYGWYPGLIIMIRRYYSEKWHNGGYTLWNWLSYPTNNRSENRKKMICKSHGLW